MSYNNVTPVYQILSPVVKVLMYCHIDRMQRLCILILERVAAQKYVCAQDYIYMKRGLFYSVIMYSVW